MNSTSSDGNASPVNGARSRAAPYVERAPLPMVEVIGPDHIVGHVNRAFCRLLGRERDDLIGRPFAATVKGGETCLPFLNQVYETGEHANWAHLEDIESGMQWLYAMWPALDEDEKPVGVIIQLARTASASDDMAEVNESLLIAGLRQHQLTAEAVKLNEQLSREMVIRSTLGRRAQLLSATAYQLLQAIPSQDWLSETLARYADELGADTFFCHLVTREGTVVIENDSGLTTNQRETLQAVLFGEDVWSGAAGRDACPGLIDGMGEAGSERGTLLRDIGVTAFASYPLRGGGNFYGITSFISHTRERFDANELNFIHTMGDLLAVGMDRQRLFEDASNARGVAERANAAKDDFIAALSHELRTPLNPVLLLATEAAANLSIDPELRADFEMIAKNVLLEAQMIDDLLDSTRIAHGKLTLQMRPLPLRGILLDAAGQVEEYLEMKELTMELEEDSADPWVNADPLRLQQVFWNILQNAIKFTPNGGQITVRTSVYAGGQRLKVDISDTGMGLNTAEISRIFDAFGQGDHSRPGGGHPFGGLGLGLAISLRLIELHGGGIRASSAGPGMGTCFTVDLPTVAAPVQPASKSVGTASAAPGPATDAAPRTRILLVEDHEPTRIVLARLLTLRQFEVVTAGTVREALKLGMSAAFELLITDIGLPDGSGIDLMKKLGPTRGLTGIALSGYGTDMDLEESRRAGFFAHLTKPVAVQLLDETVRAAVRAGAADKEINSLA